MPSNLDIWNALKTTDPAHTKKFQRAGGFKGTSVKPIYSTLKMTEQFGPAGQGWGMGQPVFDVIPAGDETLVFCTIALWWGDKENVVYGVGGDKAVAKNRNGIFADDEAFKKAYTDALSNAMKQIGMAADVHMGQHDDDKYVSALRDEINGKANGNGAPKVIEGNPRDGAGSLPADPPSFHLFNPWGDVEDVFDEPARFLFILADKLKDQGAWWPNNKDLVTWIGKAYADNDKIVKHARQVWKLGEEAWKNAPENKPNVLTAG